MNIYSNGVRVEAGYVRIRWGAHQLVLVVGIYIFFCFFKCCGKYYVTLIENMGGENNGIVLVYRLHNHVSNYLQS